LLLRIGKSLKRLDLRAHIEAEAEPADRAWHEMLRRLDVEETERRLEAMETALNGRN
jgi:hypothetical protein